MENPFRPGAGHRPPYLAGRTSEQDEFSQLLKQRTIIENVILTGLRGVGKTVLLETFKPIALQNHWAWCGTDFSESISVSEDRLAIRILTDLSLVTSTHVVQKVPINKIGFIKKDELQEASLDYSILKSYYDNVPGLVADKLKAVLELAWQFLSQANIVGIVFAYDEAQNLSDHAKEKEYPLSLLLEVFQSIQRKQIPFLLVLTGLPTLFPKLVEARTYAERMFHTMFLTRLNDEDCLKAILTPLGDEAEKVGFTKDNVNKIISISNGYPYFIQFICKEAYDVFASRKQAGQSFIFPEEDILRKLDSDFFHGRWARATERQRDLLIVISKLDNCDDEFTVQDVVTKSKEVLKDHFSASHVGQMLLALTSNGLVYKNRHGKYSLAVPLLSGFIRRQIEESGDLFNLVNV